MLIGPITGITPRDYQLHCVFGGDPRRGIGIVPGLERYKSVLVVMATGTGKTISFLMLTRWWLENMKGRVLWLSHRDELVLQPMERAAKFGMSAAREQGKQTGVGAMERIVATTVQSMSRRLNKYDPTDFSLIIIDEAHHAPADDYCKVVAHFTDAKRVGFTATPGRLDGIGLNRVFEAMAFKYPIDQANEDGWLVEVKPKEVKIPDLDLDKLRTRAGDLELEALGELMAEYAGPVAAALVDYCSSMQTIVFCCTVAHAAAQAEALRRCTTAGVGFADGSTDKVERQNMLDDFAAGRLRWLVNVQLWTEGLDTRADCIALVRPTKSVSLYQQMVGRGTRPLPGVVDDLRDAGPERRRAAIAASAKPFMHLLHFSGATTRHTLAGPLDALAGRLTPEEQLALVNIPLVGTETLDQLKLQAQKLAAAEAARKTVIAKATYELFDVDPFHPVRVFNLEDVSNDPNEVRASEKMAKYLTRNGVRDAHKLSKSAAHKLQQTIMIRDRLKLASLTQSIVLQRAGVPVVSTVKMKLSTAADLCLELHRNRGVRPRRWDNVPYLGGQEAHAPAPHR